MNCPRCMTPLAPDARFCAVCGASVSLPENAPAQAPTPSRPATPATPPYYEDQPTVRSAPPESSPSWQAFEEAPTMRATPAPAQPYANPPQQQEWRPQAAPPAQPAWQPQPPVQPAWQSSAAPAFQQQPQTWEPAVQPWEQPAATPIMQSQPQQSWQQQPTPSAPFVLPEVVPQQPARRGNYEPAQMSNYEQAQMENYDDDYGSRPRKRRKRRGGCLVSFIVVLLVLVTALAGGWMFFGRAYAHNIVQNQLDNAFTSVEASVTIASLALPTGRYNLTATEVQFNNYLANKNADPVQNLHMAITPQDLSLSFTTYGYASSITAVPVVSNGELQVTNVQVQGPLSFIYNNDEMTTTLNAHFVTLSKDLGRTIDKITLQNQQMTIQLH